MACVTDEDSDPARWAYLAEGNARQARKRVAAKVILRDQDGRVLLVNPTYKHGWDLPGGMVEANEAPTEAARRELREELDHHATIGAVLVVDWVPAHGPWDDQLVFLFDGGTLTPAEAAAIRVSDPELSEWAFVELPRAVELLRPDLGRQLTAALDPETPPGLRYRENPEAHP